MWDGVPTTVGDWLSAIDAQLVALNGKRVNESTRKTYHKIAGFARGLNRGEILTVACETESMTASEQAEEDEQD